MNIFLIGFMGTGKSSLGKKLAKRLNMHFIDSDQAIELDSQLSIPEIFSQQGEAGFRTLEHVWLEKVEDQNAVIALGGGTPCFMDNMALIQEKGISIHLVLSIGNITNRLWEAKTPRPLLKPYLNNKEALATFISKSMAQRLPFYRGADITFEASNMKAVKLDLLVKMIEDQINLKNAKIHH
ncbi:shikimate kinase [Putridiphycobacter roseus]|uniref:Shikimate kinase n=1 Tax=Putridiphycobacter roseus TaxID=2219161 RepID=A0A2W1N099_9FLAO|nr:shikimate kinase [Putridiphycobacter roseus]PZE17949.1 shikimate kinase [Putridiphycobacter roseus]